jgi:heptose I phosphotransferase
MKLVLSSILAEAWEDADPFAKVNELEGEVFREVKSRRTIRFELGHQSYFAKIHRGVGWPEIIKNLLTLRLPIVSAANEWHAINKLTELGIDTLTVEGFGKRGKNPANIQSFIITQDLVNTVDLEEYCKDWATSPPKFGFKTQLIAKLANISRRLHQAGICHRDYYLCHFHLDTAAPEILKVSLIDLHRALIKTNLARRWVLKDIGGLYFSAMDIGLTQRDRFRFMKSYSRLSLRECLTTQKTFWLRVEDKANRLYQSP